MFGGMTKKCVVLQTTTDKDRVAVDIKTWTNTKKVISVRTLDLRWTSPTPGDFRTWGSATMVEESLLTGDYGSWIQEYMLRRVEQ